MKFWDLFDKKKVTRFCLTVILQCVIVMVLCAGYYTKGKNTGIAITEQKYTDIARAEAAAKLMAEARAEAESGIVEEANAVAKVLYGTARNNSKDDQIAAVWCIINRVESNMYPSTIEGVCAQDAQWMGYSDDNPVLRELYEVAYSQLTIWHNGDSRPVGTDFIFMDWTPNSITLRTTFEQNRYTRYYSAGRA